MRGALPTAVTERFKVPPSLTSVAGGAAVIFGAAWMTTETTLIVLAPLASVAVTVSGTVSVPSASGTKLGTRKVQRLLTMERVTLGRTAELPLTNVTVS